MGDVEEIDVHTAHAMWEAGDLIVDVRLPEEYANSHVSGARNIPLRALIQRVDELPAGHVITVCSMGNRSLRAAEQLARTGITAFSIRGGTKQWAAAGYPVATASGDRQGGGLPHRTVGSGLRRAWFALRQRVRRRHRGEG